MKKCFYQILKIIYVVFQRYLPEAPVEPTEAVTEIEDGDNKEEPKAAPSLQFTHVELALFALHSLCRRAPEALSADGARLKALRLRLQYTARLAQAYNKKLKEVTQVNTVNSKRHIQIHDYSNSIVNKCHNHTPPFSISLHHGRSIISVFVNSVC